MSGNAQPRIAVIGAGIAGVTAAYWLAREGYQVTVFEREPHAGMGTSNANGGQLSVCNSGVWNTWPTIAKGIKWMLKKDAPFYLGNIADPAKLAWLAGFVAVTMRGEADQNTRRTVEMALRSREAMKDILREDFIDFDHVRRGIMHVYTSLESFRAAVAAGEAMRAAGCEWTPMLPGEAAEIEPTLRTGPQIVGAVMTPSDSTGDIHKFTNGLANVIRSRYGASILYGSEVDHILPSVHGVIINDVPYDHLVVASGPQVTRTARLVGDRMNVYPVKGYSITVDLSADGCQESAPWVSLLDEDSKIVCSRLGRDRLRVAGTAELAGHNLDISRHRIDPLLSWTRRWFPSVSTRLYQPWTGLRPMTPNMLPIVQRSRSHPRIWYHAGHGHLGWTLAAGTARTLASMIKNQS